MTLMHSVFKYYNMKVTVIGGGLIGLCCAYYLNKAGFQVIVIDKGNFNQGASYVNAGYISPSHFVPLATPGIVAKGMRWMLSSTSPFYIKPRFDMDLVKWGLAFYKSANEKKVAQNTPYLSAILNYSRELTIDIKNTIGNQFKMEEKGCLMLYKNKETEKHEIEMLHDAEKYHLKAEILTKNQVQDLEPEVELDILGAAMYYDDCHLHPGEFMNTLYNYLIERGVMILSQSEVTDFEIENKKIVRISTSDASINTDHVVLAGGVWNLELCKKLNIPLLMQGGKGYSFTYKKVERNLKYPAILVDHRCAMTPLGEDLRMGGTMEISGTDSPTLPKRILAIYDAANLYYKNLNLPSPKIEAAGYGFRPLSPDGLPYIDKVSQFTNVTIAGAHAMVGLSLAAGTGKIVADLVAEQKPEIDIEGFRVDRF